MEPLTVPTIIFLIILLIALVLAGASAIAYAGLSAIWLWEQWKTRNNK